MSPNDLTTLANLKAWLGVTSTDDDILLAALVTDVSVAILSDLGRAAVIPTIYSETLDGGGASIVLRQWPVSQLLSFTVDGHPVAIGSPLSSTPAASYCAILDMATPEPPGSVQRISMTRGAIPVGVQNVGATYRAGYEVSAEAAVIPSAPPYVVKALSPYGGWQSDGAVSYASGIPLQAGSSAASGVYVANAGTYSFAPQDAGAAVVLRYGYVPADLSRACCEWAADRYAARARIGQSSKTLGGQETTAFVVKAMPDFVARLLQPYRRVVAS